MRDAREIINRPEWFLHRIRFDRRCFEFIKIDREVIAKAVFMDEKTMKTFGQTAVLPFTELAEKMTPGPKTPARAKNFIFHISFSCSTLLSRALDRPGAVLSIREPNIFTNLADFKRTPNHGTVQHGDYEFALETGLRLLNRPFKEGECAVIKPSNIANNTIEDILHDDPKARAILLFVPLRDFLVSILKKGEAGRMFGRQFFNKLGRDDIFIAKEFVRSAGSLTDLQIVTVFWLMQMQVFKSAANAFPGHRTLLVNGEEFLEHKESKLQAILEFLDLPLDRSYLKTVIDGTVFQRNAKADASPYSTGARKEEHQAVYAANREAIEAMVKWSGTLVRHFGLEELTPWTV